MNTRESLTKDGYELQFGTNHLSHFLLFYQLKDLLLKSSPPDFYSRVVNVASAARRYGPVRLDNISFDGIYNVRLTYGSRLQTFTWRIRLGGSMVPKGFMGTVYTRGPLQALTCRSIPRRRCNQSWKTLGCKSTFRVWNKPVLPAYMPLFQANLRERAIYT